MRRLGTRERMHDDVVAGELFRGRAARHWQFAMAFRYGSVYAATVNETGMRCAIKVMLKRQIEKEGFETQTKREAHLHAMAAHSNIVAFLGCFEDDSKLYFVMERLAGGSLKGVMVKRRHKPLREDVVACVRVGETERLRLGLSLEDQPADNDMWHRTVSAARDAIREAIRSIGRCLVSGDDDLRTRRREVS
eukprot:Polyplicarium_translucidae@DN3284_c0_g1_i2.p1